MRVFAPILAASMFNAGIAYAASPESLYPVTYPAYDLPVYRLSQGAIKFDPTLLISHIKQEIDPKSWTDGDAEVAIFKNNLSLVITQTAENHKRLSKLLDSLREN